MAKSRKSQKNKGLGAGIIAFGGVFALFSVLFHPHTIGAYVLALALSGLAGAIIRTMAQGLDVSQKAPESLQKVQGETGVEAVDALLEKGRAMIMEIRSENDKIPDEALSAKLEQLENKCAEIFRTVYDKPAKASQIRKFMDYYLPTTLKMVKAYRTLDERSVNGAEAQSAKKRIQDALDVVLKACDKMLDNLYRDDMLDITTDIDVLEQMLKRDGLTQTELDKAASQARAAAAIDRETTRVQRQRAQEARQQTVQEQAKAAPAMPQWHIDSTVKRQMEEAQRQAQSHMPQTPTMDGGCYPTYDGQATAQAPKPDQQ